MAFLKKKTAVSVDDEKIQELLTRGVLRIYPSREFLEARLKSGERLTVYLGIDPTGPTLHLGHAIALRKLKEFQELGHRVILLIGDFTGMVGDPTDKSAARKKLSREEVVTNSRLYKKQASALLSFEGKNKAELAYNSTWHAQLSFEKFLDLASLLTVEQLLKRDMFTRRMEEGKPVYLHELIYPFLQGYDSVALNTDGEIGGHDQMFNMLVGRDLMRTLQNREKFVMTLTLLPDAAGKKMGKTEENMVALSDSAGEMYGKVMSWSDGLITAGFELCTLVPRLELTAIQQKLANGENPRDIKAWLAREIVSIYHGAEPAEKAEYTFNQTFREGKPVEFIDVYPGESALSEALMEKKVIASKSDLRRLIQEGAVTELSTGKKVPLSFLEKASSGKYRIGKHRFIHIK